jgi:hypothetical protein
VIDGAYIGCAQAWFRVMARDPDPAGLPPQVEVVQAHHSG